MFVVRRLLGLYIALAFVAGLAALVPARPTGGKVAVAVGPTEAVPSSVAVTSATPPTATVAALESATTAAPGTPPSPTTVPPRATRPANGGSADHKGDFGPAGPDAVTVPFAPGVSSWSVTSNRFQLSMTMTPPDANAGDPVQFVITAARADGPCCTFVGMGFGDRYQGRQPFGDGCSGASDGPTSVQATFSHVYNQAGKWHLSFGASETTGCPGSFEGSNALITILIGDGPSSAQGPEPPALTLDTSPDPPGPATGLHAGIFVWARDPDGYISSVFIDWGDGTPVDHTDGDPLPCQLTLAGWPAPSEFHAPQSQPPFIHDYALHSNYTITVTIVSTGCDGADPQQTSGTVGWNTG
jgi:hypothetical protein